LDEAAQELEAAKDLGTEADGLKASVLGALEQSEGANLTSGDLNVRFLEAVRRYMLGLDQAVKKFRPAEMATALRIESERGVTLTRSTGDSEDWFDQHGRAYDAVGNFPGTYFDAQWPTLQQQIVDHLAKAQFVPIDVAQFTPEQITQIKAFTASKGPNVFLVGE
jgi:hypothetical protein